MYESQPKKLMIINILDILKRYSDEEHRLTQKDICDLLKRDYEMSVDRRSVKSNLMDLIDAGYHINYTENLRTDKNGEENAVLTDWYLSHDFTEAELRLLIDGLLFSERIPYRQRIQLIKKLEGLSSIYFQSKVKHIYSASDTSISNAQLFYTIDLLDEAIEKKKQVEFEYCSYDVDKKLHPRKDPDGKVRKYIINPYQMAVSNGRYYLICNYDKYDNIANYRVDRIRNIKVLDTTRKPFEQTQGKRYALDLAEHVSRHFYMFSGQVIQAKLRVDRYNINDVIDYFGKDAEISDVTENDCLVRVKVSEDDMFKWAVQYSDHATVVAPESLRKKVIEALKTALANYTE